MSKLELPVKRCRREKRGRAEPGIERCRPAEGPQAESVIPTIIGLQTLLYPFPILCKIDQFYCVTWCTLQTTHIASRGRIQNEHCRRTHFGTKGRTSAT